MSVTAARFAELSLTVANASAEIRSVTIVSMASWIRIGGMIGLPYQGIYSASKFAVEVVVCLQKAFQSLASIEDSRFGDAALFHARLSLARAERALDLPEDLDIARKAAKLVGTF